MFKYSRIFFIPLIAFAASLPAHAAKQIFHATMEQSDWQVKAMPNQCVLSHEIPRFGRAHFEQQSGKPLQFLLYADQPPVSSQDASLVSVPPIWMYGSSEKILGHVPIMKGKTPIRIPRQQALRIYYELEQGRVAKFLFDDWADSRDQVEVSLSPVRFREVLADFLACTEQQVVLDFEPLSEQAVYFSTNSARLKRAEHRTLKQVARAYREQPNLRVVLGGHADERGTDSFNMNLSKRRAEFVTKYLARQGVPKQRIEQRYFGEAQPIDTANSQQAWAKNRRVTVWLAKR